MRLTTSVGLIFLAIQISAAQTSVAPKIRNEGEKILEWAKDPVLLDSIKKQNQTVTSLDYIQALDRQWVDGSISEDFIKSKLQGACAEKLKELEAKIPSAAESLVMDAQGALVCASKKTTDYWQGDEPKWKDAFDGSENLVFGARSYDESSKSTLMHISAPVTDNQKTIGVVSVGINLTKLSEY
jgi:C4-dicarboxylate-specific signal transduction histidine kinase